MIDLEKAPKIHDLNNKIRRSYCARIFRRELLALCDGDYNQYGFLSALVKYTKANRKTLQDILEQRAEKVSKETAAKIAMAVNNKRAWRKYWENYKISKKKPNYLQSKDYACETPEKSILGRCTRPDESWREAFSQLKIKQEHYKELFND